MMKILTSKKYKDIQSRLKQNETAIQELTGVRNDLISSVNQIQKLWEDKNYSGNRYKGYLSAVKEIDSKYRAESDWGCTLTGNIIDLRASFIIMQGLKVVKKNEQQNADETIKWIQDFLQYNEINGIMIYQLATEAEIEGKVALWIKLKSGENFPIVRFISWLDKRYNIETTDDYIEYNNLTWETTAGEKKAIKAGEFVYNKFGGRIADPNDAAPKVMKCLTQIEDVDRAMTDWRLINNLFAAPILHIDCDDEKLVEQVKKQLLGTGNDSSSVNWKIKKLLITCKSRANLISPSMGGVDSLKEEIISKIKLISGTTVIPIHYLGLLDLLKNRATGENTREVIITGTTKEREIWKSTWREVIKKAIMQANKHPSRVKKSINSKLNPDAFDVDIPVFTEDQWSHLERVLLPLYLANGISHRYLLSQIPNIDVEREIEEKEEKAQEMFPSFEKNDNIQGA
jgi:hypothetical protein